MLLVVLYLIKQSSTFTDVLPIIALYAFAGYRLMPAFQLIYSNVTSLRLVGPSLDAMYNDLNNLKPISDHQQHQDGYQLNKELILKNVCYNYPNSTKTTLKDVSLRIPAYSTVGLVGTTGSGKTTMIDIILGLLEPQKGTIEVDGKVINKKNLKAWQSSIGYVPQEIYLADDTVSANIAFGIDTKDIDVTNDEAILKDNKCVGYITSGGYAHHIKKSMALGYVPLELTKHETSLDVEINGNLYKAHVTDRPLYDANGGKMKS